MAIWKYKSYSVSFDVPLIHRVRFVYQKDRLRSWDAKIFVYFSEDPEAFEGIPSIPGVNRFGVNKMVEFLSPLVQKGLSSVLLFGVIDTLSKVIIHHVEYLIKIL